MDLPIPENDAVKKAVKWIFSEMETDKELKRKDLVEKASVRFDLSPTETEYLMRASKIKNV
jgi:ribosomal protein S2